MMKAGRAEFVDFCPELLVFSLQGQSLPLNIEQFACTSITSLLTFAASSSPNQQSSSGW
jgi:hypothetical protein